jgi:hypothetical protein
MSAPTLTDALAHFVNKPLTLTFTWPDGETHVAHHCNIAEFYLRNQPPETPAPLELQRLVFGDHSNGKVAYGPAYHYEVWESGFTCRYEGSPYTFSAEIEVQQ